MKTMLHNTQFLYSAFSHPGASQNRSLLLSTYKTHLSTHNVLQGDVAQSAIIPENTGQTPSLNNKCTGFYHSTWDQWLHVLSKGPKCQDRDSNPHSAEQKQSSSLVLLIARA